MTLKWFIYDWRYSVVVTMGTITGLLAMLYVTSGALDENNMPWYFSSVREYQGMMLLVTFMPAYILGASIYSQRRAMEIAKAIDSHNNLSLAGNILNVPGKGIAVAAAVGFLYAVIFNVPGTGLHFPHADNTERAMMLGQILIWMLLACLLYVRIRTSRNFRAVSESVDIDIFEPSNLRPFAQLSLIDILIIAVGLVLSTVQSLDFSFRPDNYSKALVILVPASIFLVLYPIWGIHKRMKKIRQDQLDELNRLIRQASKSLDSDDLHNLEILLQRRERVAAAPTWPVDVSTLQRFTLYIIIPPLAWVGAALVELLIDALLSG